MKITQIRSFWRAFKDMERYSGSHYEHESGLLLMSEDDENLCIEKYGSLRSKIATEGLPISNNINFEEYDEIFSDDKPAGKQIHPPRDRTYWQGRTRGRVTQIEAVEEAVEEAAAAHDAIEEEAADEVEAEEGAALRDDYIFISSSQDTQDSQQSLPISRDHSREAGNSPGRRSTASSPPQTRQRAQNRSTSRPRKRDEDRDGMPWGEIKEILMHQETRRTHNVVSYARPVGSQDIEKAIANCEEVMKEKELSLMIRVICWFQEDPGNAVVWNALGSVAAKEA
ncbi:hypothetical protein LCI18_007751 [Fusarium solani-melongenae]|uniref:Uncharacterized protein n=1 Tax=Fusarium solani subsp. cucurbitae TaxID=2747967 RepID=A0ACD3Z7I9_FUSSC|nr:hypothetical protein LCI18_007751 [Fusarium solani-melongenae]